MIMTLLDAFLTAFIIVSFITAINIFLTSPQLRGKVSKVSSGKELGIASDLSNQKTNKTMDLNITFPTDPATQNEPYLSAPLYVAGSFPQDNKDLTINYSQQGQQTYRSSTHT